MDMDRRLDILAELHLVRMDAARAARRLGIPESEVAEARAYELAHGREIYMAGAERARRGGGRRLRLLDETVNR
jgi:hypothetical protein